MPAFSQAADFPKANFSSGTPTAPQASQPAFRSGQSAQRGTEVATPHQPQQSWQQPEAAAPVQHSKLAHDVSV